MTSPPLEDFATRRMPLPDAQDQAPAVDPAAYEAAYGAGWDDAMARIEAERMRLSEGLAASLLGLSQTREQAARDTVLMLEPLLHDVFDKLLPHAADRGFVALLVEEARAVLEASDAVATIRVAPEEEAALTRLVQEGALDATRVAIEAEPALAPSQALLRWQGQEREVDLIPVLAGLDAALAAFTETLGRETPDD